MEPAKYVTNYQPVVDTDPNRIVTLDFESYWDSKEFTLRKMSMEEHVRDPRFLVHGLGVKFGAGQSHWIEGHKRVEDFFHSVSMHRYTALAQNAPFDGLVMSHIYNVYPAAWLDTQAICAMLKGNAVASVSLAKMTEQYLPGQVKDQTPLHSVDGIRHPTPEQLFELGEYCKGDCDKTYALFALWRCEMQATPMNADLIDLITTMFTDPVLELDVDVLDQLIANELVEKQTALDGSIATSFKQLNSNPQFATLLQSQGVEPPVKISPTTTEETFAFAKSDRGFIELLEHESLPVRTLVAARLRCKTSINETRAKKYKAVATRGTWPVHLHVSGARTTHRLSGASGGGGNPQNLGKKSPLRAAILPPEGFRMFVVDSKAIELRDAMALSGERDEVVKLRDIKYDPYKDFAATIYSQPVGSIDHDQRSVGKVGRLQLQYQSGAATFRDMAWSWGIEIAEEEAQRITTLYRSTYNKVKKMWETFDRLINLLERGKEEETWFDDLIHPDLNGPDGHPCMRMPETGLAITYPNLAREYNDKFSRWQLSYDTFDNKTRRLVRSPLYGGKAFQHACQALARNVVMEQTVALDTFLKREIHWGCRTTMSVHDESVCLVPEHADCDAALAGALEIYGTSPVWWPDLPVFGEAAWGDNYGEAK